jgi:hypothetical protein
MILLCETRPLFFNIDLPNLIVGAIGGAIVGLVASQMFLYFQIWRFCRKNLKPLLGTYSVTLKSGKPYDSVSDRMNIIRAKGKIVKIKNEDIEIGEIQFQSENYGRGWYKTKGSNLYGFYELIILDSNKIAALRKYTTDNDKGEESFKSVEASFIWEKK